MTRSTPDWIGKTDDAAIPARVRVRVFERDGGICHLSGRRIRAGDLWDVDHIVALVNGGKHCESNLAPALRDKHREKTKADMALKSKNYQVRAKHLGLAPKGRPMPGSRASGLRKRMDGTVERRS
jgi:5-methylcytosine-specific restriction endonuclease McrA